MKESENMTTVAAKGSFNFVPQTFKEAMDYCKMVSNSNFCPKEYKGKPDEVFVAMQHGAELGLKALQALQSIAVINGKPGIYGDVALALCKTSPDYEYVKEWEENGVFYCEAKRKGEPAKQSKFGDEEAKRAGLFGKQGPWSQYPQRMKMFRARGFALRDVFPHVLKGLAIAEELQDYPTERSMGDAKIIEEETSRADILKQQLGITASRELNIGEDKNIDSAAAYDIMKSPDDFIEKIEAAKTEEELKKIGEEISQDRCLSVESTELLKEKYKEKKITFKKTEPDHMSKIFERNINVRSLDEK